jgi:hypothetical protein
MQEVLPILTLFLAPFSLSIPIKSFICPGFMFIQQALSRLALKIVVMARQEAIMQEARVKRVWAILLFFTQIGFIVFTYLILDS